MTSLGAPSSSSTSAAKSSGSFDWSGRRVLLTGHTGFKGSWLAYWLHQRGALVSGLALEPQEGRSLYHVLALDELVDSTIGTIADLEMVSSTVERTAPEVVFHLAAQALVRPSYDDPVETFSTNVLGTVHLLEAIRRAPSVKAFVSVTSDKCYENREWPWGYRESEAMGGHDPYSASKGCAELVTASMRRSFFSEPGSALVASARAGNVIGGGDWSADRLIPDIVKAFSKGEEVVIRRPDAVRPWQHVLEPLSGYLRLAESMLTGDASVAEGWNFGPADLDARPVGWIVETMAAKWGDGASYRVEREGPHEATLLKLDCSKAAARLGWRPRLTLEEALDWVVDWYRSEAAGADMRKLTADQIDAFMALHDTP